MPRTYTNLLFHIIFSTKDRLPQISQDLKPKLHGYLWGIAQESKAQPIALNGTADHVHLLAGLKPDTNVSDFVRTLKANSSKWIHQERGIRRFAWQLGFAAFSVSHSNRPAVVRYIADQETHHRKRSFQEELISFLKRNRIEYDERYLWQ